MKIELEITPEIEEWYKHSKSVLKENGYLLCKGQIQMINQIEKAKNEIKPGDLVKYKIEKNVAFFIVDKIEGDKINDLYFIETCIKATKEEEALIRPLLEK